MTSRTGTYCAFYVAEPFSQSALGAHATEDFRYYNLLRTWKGADDTFPFVDSHGSTYNVRDGSEWEGTLKPRLRERLRYSKNIVLFLSYSTLNSRALREEVDYGINDQGLPVIVVYPDFKTESDIVANGSISANVSALWNSVPTFRDSRKDVPVIHVPMKKDRIRQALSDTDFMLNSKGAANDYWYKP